MLLVVGIAVPLGLFGVLDLQNMWQLSRAQLDDSVKQQVELTSVALERWLIDQRNALATIAALAGDNDPRTPAIQENLEHLLRTRPFWIDLRITNATGTTIVAQPARKDMLPTALTDHLVSEMREHRSWIVVTDRTVDEARPVVVMAVPIVKGGAVIARIDGAAINELFNRIQLSSLGVISVLASDGRVLYRRRGSEAPSEAEALMSSLPSALGTDRLLVTERTSPIDGIKRLYGLVRVGDTGLLAMIGIPSARLYEPARQRLNRHALVGLFALLVAVGAALVVERSIVIPVRRLRSTAQQLGAGDLSARAPVREGGEIGDLGKAFNTMATQIAEREERLTELDRLKSEFVSSVSHELKTPLTTIKLLAHLLQRPEIRPHERLDYSKTIASECDRQIDFVGNLLDLSRIESGAYKLTKKKVEIGELIRSCIEVERHRAEENGLVLTSDVEIDVRPVQGEHEALRRVVRGLIDNAIKYTPAGGHIAVKARSTEAGVELTVADDGPGISPTNLPHIFEKFYRADPDTDTDHESASTGTAPGVGLGLYLARHIVEQLGGTITVASKPGRGTVFRMQLQLWSGSDQAETAVEEESDVEAAVGS